MSQELSANSDRVIVKPVESGEERFGSIIIPDMGKEKPEMAEVIAISNVYNFNTDTIVPTDLEVGMKVLLPKMGAQTVTIDGEEYYITAQNSILSIVE